MSALITKQQKEIAFKADKALRDAILLSKERKSQMPYQFRSAHRDEDYRSYAEAVWQITAVRVILDERNMDVEDMELIAWGLVLPVLPEPTIRYHTGASVLIPTLFVLEPERLHALACDLERLSDRDSRMDFMSQGARNLHSLHQTSRGAGDLSAASSTPGGCLGMVLSVVFIIIAIPVLGFYFLNSR